MTCQSRWSDGPWGEQDYTYDGVGNRLTYTSTVGGVPAVDTYTYGLTANRLLAVTGAAARAFTCDAAGNVIYDARSGVGYGYGYDAAGRMDTLSIDGVVQAEYVYNALGQQVIRRLPQAAQTIHSVHDVDGNRIAEYLWNGATATLIREYVWMAGQAVAAK